MLLFGLMVFDVLCDLILVGGVNVLQYQHTVATFLKG